MSPPEVHTCPKCGAYITPQLERCRHCQARLHPVPKVVRSFDLDTLLPEDLRRWRGVTVLMGLLILFYLVMVAGAGFGSLLGLSAYSLRVYGALDATGVLRGESWRFFTSMLGHGGVIHLGFNLMALHTVGPLTEQLFSRNRTVLLFVFAGIFSMVSSFVVNVLLLNNAFFVSVGASGAISALIGANWAGTRRIGPRGRDLSRLMLRYTAFIALFGLVMPAVDNAAHAGGWLAGALLGYLLPLTEEATGAGRQNRSQAFVWLESGLLLMTGGLMIGVVTKMLTSSLGLPGELEHDAQPKRLLFFTIAPGKEWKHSSQVAWTDRCLAPPTDLNRSTFQTKKDDCRIAIRALPIAENYAAYALALDALGETQKAARMRQVQGWLKKNTPK